MFFETYSLNIFKKLKNSLSKQFDILSSINKVIFSFEKENLIAELSKNGFTIKNWDIPIDVKMETNIIQNIHKNLIPWIKKNISYRKVCRPKSNNEGIKIDLYPLNF